MKKGIFGAIVCCLLVVGMAVPNVSASLNSTPIQGTLKDHECNIYNLGYISEQEIEVKMEYIRPRSAIANLNIYLYRDGKEIAAHHNVYGGKTIRFSSRDVGTGNIAIKIENDSINLTLTYKGTVEWYSR